MIGNDGVPDNKGTRTKIISVLVVFLFIATAFCAMMTVPVESETVANDDFAFMKENTDTSDLVSSDNPSPFAVDDIADFTSKDLYEKSLNALNKYLPEGYEPCKWDEKTKTLYLAPVNFETTCKNITEGPCAAIKLPEGSTVQLMAGCRVVVDASATKFTNIYGLYCSGDLHIVTNDYTVEFVLGKLMGKELAKNEFSAGVCAMGKLTVSGNQTGRLAVVSGANGSSPTIGIYAKDGFEVKNSELLITANIGSCLGGAWEFGKYCTVGLYSPSVTFDCMDCQKVKISGGVMVEKIEGAKSCGILTENMEVKHGKVIALGGSDFEVEYSIGIDFKGKECTLKGNGVVCAGGGNALEESIGINSDYVSKLTITIPNLYLSGSYSGGSIFGMKTGYVKMSDTHVNSSISVVKELEITCGMKCRYLIATNSEFDIAVDACNHSWCMLLNVGILTGCKIHGQILNSPYNNSVDGIGMAGEHIEFNDCEVYIHSGDSRFTAKGISVQSPGEDGDGCLIFNRTKAHIETGNNIGVGMVECFALYAYELKVTESELYVKGGNSDATYGLWMNGRTATIEKSKVTFIGGDLITYRASNSGGITCGVMTAHDMIITDSEACFYGGKVADDTGQSYGLILDSKKDEQLVKITNTKFDADGETAALRSEHSDLCKISCPELYGKNKQTGNFEKFDIKDIDNYTEIATSNWIEDKKTKDEIPVNVIIVAILMALLVVIGIVMYYRRERA